MAAPTAPCGRTAHRTHPSATTGAGGRNVSRPRSSYDPADLAAVATGAMGSGEPQPYAVLDIEDVIYKADFILLNHLGAAAFDRERGLLYVLEPLADEERSIVHVWRVGE